ncbi:hypothetical protein C8R44DRAFT_882439 [Mycena epipterygia]|nr:hypothetical protein C8R44DRAFT_882439 [Mycena epipterygia]
MLNEYRRRHRLLFLLSALTELAALQPVIEANLASQCAVDVLIAIILSIMFSYSKTSVKRTDKVPNHLIQTAIQSGIFTGIFAFGTLLLFHFSSGTYMLTLFAFPTMMDHFVGREELRNMLASGNIISISN